MAKAFITFVLKVFTKSTFNNFFAGQLDHNCTAHCTPFIYFILLFNFCLFSNLHVLNMNIYDAEFYSLNQILST